MSTVVAYFGSAASLMGSCGSGATASVENRFLCGRSPEVFGLTLDRVGRTLCVDVAGQRPDVRTTQQTGDLLY